ncbi:P-loop containing nucleoside triphosphate hydrolase protein [Backusella circina FSU 941]|nr:P-loop containing nucleoside triphosphate hydrolase protein [Backusella circina FSU 941]
MLKRRVHTIGVSGPSCSGKTTLSLILKKTLKNVIVISQDAYFKPDDQIPLDETTGLANWDCPGAIDFDALNLDISRIRDEVEQDVPLEAFSKIKYDGSVEITQDQLHSLREHLHILDHDIFIIVEGFMLFYNKTTCSLLDYKFFVTASKDVLEKRRLNRKGYETKQGFWVDPPNYFNTIVWPQYIKWNSDLLDKDRRDPTIKVLETDVHSIDQVAITATDFLLFKK